MAEPIACPLCGGPTEEHEAYRDRACPKYGLSAPPDVLEKLRVAEEQRRTYCDDIVTVSRLNAEQAARLRALEAELARLKQPERVLAEAERLLRERDSLERLLGYAQAERDAALNRIAELDAKLNTPHTADFLEAVRLEAAHQRERWAAAHDAGKSDADWFWLLGYLAGKAIRPDCTPEKKLHHIITTAAACLNWHAHATGQDTRMRPGIEAPNA
jgi:hypothetical protein